VSWKNVRPVCSDDVINYILYYKNTVDELYQKIFETDSTFYLYDGTDPIAGCYAIQSQDSSGNLSAMSQDFCIDICPVFELPNIFSPNKDGANDFYKAIKVRQVKQIDLTILDRWGNPLYRTSDPYFEWDGINAISRKPVSEGTLFYVCTVYEPRVNGLTRRVLKGTVQLVR
jgi:gliding motility-associated-like protein